MSLSTRAVTGRDVPLGDPAYPARIASLEDAPVHISVAGAPLVSRIAIAIVGTREPEPEASAFAKGLAAACVEAGALVISGGAKGIDAAAHEGALQAGGPTCAVLGTGRKNVYPAEHEGLYERIASSGGTLIWPFPPGAPALRHNFPHRNRILVALADVVVVVQAPARSGALNAAKHARLAGRPLWAVLAAPWNAAFAGCARLIEGQSATPLTSTSHFLRSVGLDDLRARLLFPFFSGGVPATSDPVRELASDEAAPCLSPDEKHLVAAVGERPRHVDELIYSTGRSSAAVRSALLTLVLAGVLVEGPEGFYRRLSDP